MHLIDTNVFLEILLKQEKSNLAKSYFSQNNHIQKFVSDLSFHSIGILMFKIKRFEIFNKFILDLQSGNQSIIGLKIDRYKTLKDISEKYNLDFDDSYQYLIAKTNNLTLISFDKDFDKTDLKRIEP